MPRHTHGAGMQTCRRLPRVRDDPAARIASSGAMLRQVVWLMIQPDPARLADGPLRGNRFGLTDGDGFRLNGFYLTGPRWMDRGAGRCVTRH